MVSFDPSEEEALVQRTAREFASRELAPGAAQRDRRGEFPAEALRRLAVRGPADNLSVGRWLHCTSTRILLKEMREFTDALPVVL